MNFHPDKNRIPACYLISIVKKLIHRILTILKFQNFAIYLLLKLVLKCQNVFKIVQIGDFFSHC